MSEPKRYEAASPGGNQPAVRSWTGGDLIIGSALVALIISLFLPWYSYSSRLTGLGVVAGTLNGPDVHSYLWVVLVLGLIGLAALIGRDVIQQLPGNWPSPGQIMIGTSGLALVLTVLAALSKPVVHGPTATQQLASFDRISFGWSFGGLVAVVAALVALLVAFVTSGPLQEASRARAVGSATG
jgi:hypothetical protein